MLILRVLVLFLLLWLLPTCVAQRELQSARLRSQAAKEWTKRYTTPPEL